MDGRSSSANPLLTSCENVLENETKIFDPYKDGGPGET